MVCSSRSLKRTVGNEKVAILRHQRLKCSPNTVYKEMFRENDCPEFGYQFNIHLAILNSNSLTKQAFNKHLKGEIRKCFNLLVIE